MANPKPRPKPLDPVLADDGSELSGGGELGEGEELGSRAKFAGFHALAALPMPAAAAAFSVPFSGATGEEVLAVARQHLGEAYVLGARAPMGNAGWAGPWDCAEFVSWCVYRASGILFGTEPRADPMLADAYTGFWFQQAQAGGALVDWREAAGIAGAVLLRRPMSGHTGHIVLSDGRGGSVEAHSRVRGVIPGSLSGRRWDCGILVPGIRYLRSDTPVVVDAGAETLRLTNPLTRGDSVRAVQQRLVALGLLVGDVDGIFGPQTAHAVRAFQARKGMVPDGEVGQLTWAALGLDPD